MTIEAIFISAIVISLLHGLIPSHWMPLLVLGKTFKWSQRKLLWISFKAAFFHSISTVIIGISIALLGKELEAELDIFTHAISAAILILIGIWFLFRHYHHHHFHLEDVKDKSVNKIILSLNIAMFFSPCLEVTGQFLLLGSKGFNAVLLLALVYTLITIASMLIWVSISSKLMSKIDSHKWEHNIGLASGIILILTGVLLYLF